MTHHHLVSIIIPALNEAETIRPLLKSLQGARSEGHEVILVDGGSEDKTTELAQPLVDRLITTTSGRAWQMNQGAAVASGSILWFLHADSAVPEQVVSQMIEALNSPNRHWGRFSVTIAGKSPLLWVVGSMMNLRSCLTGIATGDQGIFVRRAVFDEVGGFPNIPLMEDIAISKRLKRLARPVCISEPIVTAGRRWDRDGVMRTIWLMWRLRLAFALGANPQKLYQDYYRCNTRTDSC